MATRQHRRVGRVATPADDAQPADHRVAAAAAAAVGAIHTVRPRHAIVGSADAGQRAPRRHATGAAMAAMSVRQASAAASAVMRVAISSAAATWEAFMVKRAAGG